MTLCLEKGRRAWVRLLRPLHGALLELRAEHPRPVMFSTSQFVRFEPRLTDWGLTATIQMPNGINGDLVRGETLNALGLAFAKHLLPLSPDKRTNTPLIPLADVLADLPQSVFDWISRPPIQKHKGGMLFEALGVLLPDFAGEVYRPSRELGMALAEVAYRRSGKSVRSDGPANPLLSPMLTAAVQQCLVGKGVPWRTSEIDGRLLRPLLDSDGAGVVTLRMTPVNPSDINAGEENHWTVPYHMRRIAKGLVDGDTDPFTLVTMCPEDYQHWLANGLPIDSVPPHPRLLALIGVVKKKGRYDWAMTPLGRDIQHRVGAFLRAQLNGSPIAPDDTPYDGDGVDISLPDVGGDGPYQPLDQEFAEFDLSLDDPFDIMGDTPGASATLAALDSLSIAADHAQRIIEAPVPSNAELARARAEREARQAVADLTLEDDFDI